MSQRVMDSNTQKHLAALLVLATLGYQALLCLVNTQLFAVSRSLLMAGEVLILVACIPLLLPRILPRVAIVAVLAGALLCLLALLRGSIDIKAFRDLLIPLWFYWLGRNLGSPGFADRLLVAAVAVVLGVGLFELFATDVYTGYFNIFSYYVNTGSLTEITEYERESLLQMNGIRPEGIGRTLLPGLLDNHRVSSIFLEPVSMGNFATILAAWGLARERQEWPMMMLFLGAAVIFTILADSRFALVSVALLLAARFLLQGWALYLPVLMPFTIALVLVIISTYFNVVYSDSYLGRLFASGNALTSFDTATLLGYSESASFPDQGYAYVASAFGLVLVVSLWMTFWLIPMPDTAAHRFRSFVAIYMALILCVSGTSLFALKTAGLLWFLVGTSLRDPAPTGTTAGSAGKSGPGRMFSRACAPNLPAVNSGVNP